MDTVQIKKADLLDALRKNLVTHKADYEESVLGYQKLAKQQLESKLDELDRNPLAQLTFGLAIPQSHAKTYEHTIRMLELETRDVIELTTDQFSCFVMDDWGWKEAFTRTTTTYKSFK